MAYASAGLRQIRSGVINKWALDTVDSVATAVGAGYVTDGTSSTTSGTPGKGMQVGDEVYIRVVGALTSGGSPPATMTDGAYAFVSAVNTTTGACSLTLSHTNA